MCSASVTGTTEAWSSLLRLPSLSSSTTIIDTTMNSTNNHCWWYFSNLKNLWTKDLHLISDLRQDKRSAAGASVAIFQLAPIGQFWNLSHKSEEMQHKRAILRFTDRGMELKSIAMFLSFSISSRLPSLTLLNKCSSAMLGASNRWWFEFWHQTDN